MWNIYLSLIKPFRTGVHIMFKGIPNSGKYGNFLENNSTYQLPIWQHWAISNHATSYLADNGSSKTCFVDGKNCQQNYFCTWKLNLKKEK
jgi:hypothetical protein